MFELSELHKVNDYFKLREFFISEKNNLKKENELYYNALLNSYFNKLEESNNNIDELLEYKNLSDSLKVILYQTKIENYVREYEYRNAFKCCKLLMDEYVDVLDSVRYKDLIDSYAFCKALIDIPEQKMVNGGHEKIPVRIDDMGFWNVNVHLKDTICGFVFDTGAGSSIIRKSIAEKCGYRLIELEYPVKAFTGKNIRTNLAIAEKISIGNLQYDNVVFLVVDDESLTFSNGKHQINGIIGFPVIHAMQELHIENNSIRIPDNFSDYDCNNLAVNYLSPVVAVQYKQDTLLFKFDTGALRSNLQPLFYEKYKEEIDKSCTKKTIKAGSIGGMVEFDVYRMCDVEFRVASGQAKIDRLSVYTEDIKSSNHDYHGHLGQDFVKQFDNVIISFKNSSIIFE